MNCSRAALNDAVLFQHGKDCAEEAFNIHKKAHVLNIVTVKPCFFFNFKLVSAVDLRPAGKPGTYIICALFVAFGNKIKLVP